MSAKLLTWFSTAVKMKIISKVFFDYLGNKIIIFKPKMDICMSFLIVKAPFGKKCSKLMAAGLLGFFKRLSTCEYLKGWR